MATILDRVTIDIERHAAASGWDQPPRLFALVETADLVRREPQLATELGWVPASRASRTAPAGSPRSSRTSCPSTPRSRSCSAASPGRPRCWARRSSSSG